MRNLLVTTLGIVVSIFVLTGFGHGGLFLCVFFLGYIGLCVVKKKWSSRRHGCRVLGCGLALLSVMYFASGQVVYTVSEESVVRVFVTSRLKIDTVVARRMDKQDDSRLIDDTPILIQSSGEIGDPGSVLQIVVDQRTPAVLPTIQWSWSVPVWQGGFEYGAWLAMKGVGGHIRSDRVLVLPGSLTDGIGYESLEWNDMITAELHSKLNSSYSPQAVGLIHGMLVGGRSGLTQESYEYFVDSGLVHLIAVSGSNIMMIVLFLHLVLFWVPYYVRLGVIVVVISGYSVLCGLDSSVMRALVMGLTMLGALFVGRRVSIWRSLSYACIVLLMVNPWMLLFDVGFLLSFGALLGVLLLVRWVQSMGKTSKVWGYVVPSFGATLGVFPVLIIWMDMINLLSPFVNLVVVPFVPVILLGGLLGVVGIPWVRSLVEWLIDGMFVVSEWGMMYGVYLSVSGRQTKVLLIVGVGSLLWVMYVVSKMMSRRSEEIIIRT